MRSYPATLHRIFDPDMVELAIDVGFGEPRRARVKLIGFDIEASDEERGRLLDFILQWIAEVGRADPENPFPLRVTSDGDEWTRPAVYSGEIFGGPGPASLNLSILEFCRRERIAGFCP